MEKENRRKRKRYNDTSNWTNENKQNCESMRWKVGRTAGQSVSFETIILGVKKITI